ncbi:putative F-box protein At1g50870 isoform X1 [Papaver somniferum]|nr:putative F-box protein At1g50870 isoform X1 [Papaver somniferum]XP_026385538.1 putative F-box protein At1g50870 isoform X1 [Papaver somniferum]XP_026385539.1 putative F-box protein At1g50870 isoform X1 [Papaver somniferum]XP_026385540.1 putative F-box protein At1g50870 isoform X1 [Papaver somniferum]XP_026385541.1 putative F-box protein At1g50870 isoform X1 [Papaver somniferum]
MQTAEASAHLHSESSNEELLSIKNGLVLAGNLNKKTADHLPIDLVIEILCRVPVRSLIMFKCVSKSWNKLNSQVCLPRLSSNVCVLRFYRGRTRRLSDQLCFSGTLPELNSASYVSKGNMYHHEIDCCNGLSLCDGAYGSGYVVVNLATRQHFSIPEPLKLPGWNFAAIVFGPIQSNDYTIVRPNPYYDTPSLDIFSSEIGKWVRHIVPGDWVEHLCIREFGSPMLGIKWAKGNVYLDGMLYLLIRGKHLVQFDLKSLAVSAEVIKVPCGANGHGLIGHSRGILYYVNYDKEFRLSMWQLDYHSISASIWVLRHSICTDDMLDQNPGILHTMKLKNRRRGRLFEPFGIHPFSDIIFLGLQGRRKP